MAKEEKAEILDTSPDNLERLSRDELIALVNHLAEANKELEEKYYIDPVTQIHTRSYYLKETVPKVDAHIKNRGTEAGRQEIVLVGYIDLDNLKKINDSKGHSAGDYALRKIAEMISAQIRDTDTLFRCGEKSDEFGLIMFLPKVDDLEDFVEKLKIRCRINLIEATKGIANADISMDFVDIDDVSRDGQGHPILDENGKPEFQFSTCDEALHAADLKMIAKKNFRKSAITN